MIDCAAHRNRRLFWLPILLAGLVATGCTSEETPPGDDVPQRLERPDAGVMGDGRLGEILDYVVADTGLPAVSAMFLHQGLVLEQAVAGVRSNGEPTRVTEEDQWHIGSLTKSMTATLAAVMVEDGVLRWDTTIADLFPELSGSIDPAYMDIRLDELLSHTGGVSTHTSDLAQAVSRDGGDLRSQRYRLTERVLAQSPEHPRGSYAYSNAGYIVAGAMLERATNMAWESLISEFVFAPLGMQDSGFGPPGKGGPGMQPTGHIPDGSGWYSIPADSVDADNPPVFGPAGTVHSTMADLANYMAAHLIGTNGNDIPGFLSVDSFEKLHQPMSEAAYALGWIVSDVSIYHDGSNNRWSAFITIVPSLDIALFVATNAADPEADDGGAPLRAMTELQNFFQLRFEALVGNAQR